jgi:branched-chain amino acid transport system substrate-binding protein
VKEYFAFMKQYLPNADLSQFELRCRLSLCQPHGEGSDGLQGRSQPREHHETGRVAARGDAAAVVAGITVSTEADDYLPFQQLRLRRFDGKSWVGFDEILDDG